MQPNPYQAPTSDVGYAPGFAPRVNRTPFVLAAVGAWLASAYWAGMTLLVGVGVAAGSIPSVQIALPCLLIGLYAWRGLQLFRGDRRAARRILWLHAVGGIVAVIAMTSCTPSMMVLHGVKVAIHVFGAMAAYLVIRTPEASVL